MPAYVTLPGTSGNYFSTPDVNLLDADTAHLQQSVGGWANWSAGAFDPVLSSDVAALFGDYTMKTGILTGDDIGGCRYLVPFDLTMGTQYTIAASVYSTTPIAAYDASSPTEDGGRMILVGGSNPSVNLVHTGSGWERFSVTFTPGATITGGTSYLYFQFSHDTSDPDFVLYIDNPIIRTGSDGTFVPSARIVNDLEIEWKVALDDYTPAATNTILDCLSSNDGYRIRHTTGDLIEVAYGNGSSTRAQTSSATGLTDGEEHVFKVTVDQSTGAVVYYIDGVQHDTDTMTTGAGQPDINDLVIGANAAASANWTAGHLYYVIVRDGISGPVVARFDADDWVGV